MIEIPSRCVRAGLLVLVLFAAVARSADAPPAVLLLPPEFIVYSQGVGATEPVPEWTNAAQENLAAAARQILEADGRFHVVDLPSITDAEREGFREHVELFKIVASNLDTVVKAGGKPWAGTRQTADYRIGDGLRFLTERTGAQYALVLAGSEIRQTGGSAFMQLMVAGLTGYAAPGGGSYMSCGIVDLQTGRITWYNSSIGVQVFGIGGANTKEVAGASKSISALFKTYPSSPGLSFVDLGADATDSTSTADSQAQPPVEPAPVVDPAPPVEPAPDVEPAPVAEPAADAPAAQVEPAPAA